MHEKKEPGAVDTLRAVDERLSRLVMGDSGLMM